MLLPGSRCGSTSKPLLGSLVAATAGLFCLVSLAQSETLPSGTIGASTILMTGTGSTRKQLGVGFGVGFTAAWQPMRTDQFIGYGLRWSTQFLFFNYLDQAESARINTRLKMYQADFGARARITIAPGNYLTLGGGLALLRSTEPVIAEGAKSWAGPFSAFGLERYVLSGLLMTIDLRYGLLLQGPSSIGVSLTLGTGT
jgi:hypothetical protein